MSAEAFEAEIQRHILTLEAECDEAARRVEEAKDELRSKKELLSTWIAALEDFQHRNGLSVKVDYSKLKPRERVELWADKHDGTVVMRDLANALVEAGAIKTYKSALSSIRWSLSGRDDYEQVEHGVYKRVEGTN
ncbi:MAG: hypothetical protein F4X83_03315 [Chloroflexi bacterium]|nr:hypothetical protein [Chloroflexota bacterium]